MEDGLSRVQAEFPCHYAEDRHNNNNCRRGSLEMRIDPKLIIDFATIVEEGSFTGAARRLRVAQPWLSARLQKLEQLLGFRLLDRTTRRVMLTERGAEFLEASRQVAQAAEAADRLALQLKRSHRSVLRIGAAPYTKFILQRQELIDKFALSHPKMSLELETGWSHALMDRLKAGEIDLTFIMGDCWPPCFDGIVLRNYGVALTMSREHPLAGAASLPPDAVIDKPIQVYTRSLFPELWEAMYAPLIRVGARFVEVPEMAEGPLIRMRPADEVAAFFDFGADDPGAPDVVRIPLTAPVAVPFQLMRRTGPLSSAGEAFWSMARRMAV